KPNSWLSHLLHVSTTLNHFALYLESKLRLEPVIAESKREVRQTGLFEEGHRASFRRQTGNAGVRDPDGARDLRRRGHSKGRTWQQGWIAYRRAFPEFRWFRRNGRGSGRRLFLGSGLDARRQIPGFDKRWMEKFDGFQACGRR